MIRKLALCVVGALFEIKSALCISTAMVICAAFWALHFHYYPYQSMACNRLQAWSLTVQLTFYLIGLLLKVNQFDSSLALEVRTTV
jgi:hypothetical protein